MRRVCAVLRDTRGFGLTELAVAIVVLGIVLVGIFPLIFNSLALAQGNADTAVANRIVASQLDEVRQNPPAACAVGAVTDLTANLTSTQRASFTATQRITACASHLATVKITALRGGTAVASATTKVVVP